MSRVTLLYINGSRIPTERAHGLQIMKMCSSFANAKKKIQNPNNKLQTKSKIRNPKSEISVELWIPRRLNYVKQDAFKYYNIEKNFKIRKFFCIDLVPWDRFLGPLAMWITELSFMAAISYKLKAKSSDVIYTRDKFVAFAFSFFFENIFFEAHDVPSGIFFSRLKKVKGIVAITQNLKNEFIKRGVNGGKIIVASDGVDIEEFDIPQTKKECRERLGLSLGQKIVLYTGHLYKWKGADVLFEVARQESIVNNQELSKLFIFVGGTDKEVAEYRMLNAKYLIRNTQIIGHRPHKEIPYWIKAADVLVLPNSAKHDISQYWTSPMKLFEYMASQRPIVASDLPSIREVLNESNAKMFEPDNPKDLARAIKYLLQNPLEMNRISLKSYQDVRYYSWRIRARNVLRFMEQ